MKISIVVCIFTLITQAAHAQKHDYVWVAGDDNSPTSSSHGGITIDFNQDSAVAYYNYREHNMYTTNASICDTNGNLLFYTNGCIIAGFNDSIIENGHDINPGGSHDLWCDDYNDGYAGGPQNTLILPSPDSIGIFYLFHKNFVIKTSPTDIINDKLYYSIVNMNLNNGFGKVTDKNVLLLNDTLAHGELVATKHANGKDWWIITPERNSNSFIIFRLGANGISNSFEQTLGLSPHPSGEAIGQIIFSPDGTKLFRCFRNTPILMYSFDRASGLFTQFDTISYYYGNQFVGETGCAVSPNGRFLYLACRKFLFQFDLLAPDISASQTLVAEWDGYANPIATLFWQLQLGPDCKIYGLAGGDTRFYHVIHNPDEPGLACNVEQRGLPLPTPSGSSMPSFPNYRLGPLDNPGLPCSATVGSQQVAAAPEGFLRVYPNPASDHLNIIANHPLPSGACWLLSNAQGRVLHTEMLSEHTTCMEILLPSLPSGVYFWHLQIKEGAVVSAGKVVVSE